VTENTLTYCTKGSAQVLIHLVLKCSAKNRMKPATYISGQ